MKKRELIKIAINIPKPLKIRIEEYSDNVGLNQTSTILLLLKQSLDNNDIIQNLASKKQRQKSKVAILDNSNT